MITTMTNDPCSEYETNAGCGTANSGYPTKERTKQKRKKAAAASISTLFAQLLSADLAAIEASVSKVGISSGAERCLYIAVSCSLPSRPAARLALQGIP